MVTAGILPFRENSNGRTGNRTRILMISRQRLWPLDHEAGLNTQYKMCYWVLMCVEDVFKIYCRTSKVSAIIKLSFGSRFVSSAALHWTEILYILSELSDGCLTLLCCRLHLLLVESWAVICYVVLFRRCIKFWVKNVGFIGDNHHKILSDYVGSVLYCVFLQLSYVFVKHVHQLYLLVISF